LTALADQPCGPEKPFAELPSKTPINTITVSGKQDRTSSRYIKSEDISCKQTMNYEEKEAITKKAFSETFYNTGTGQPSISPVISLYVSSMCHRFWKDSATSSCFSL
jgi:hypothetical protein